VALIVAPLATFTVPMALKTMMPPLVPFQALAVSDTPLEIVTSVHWGTRCTTTFWLAKFAPP
jgi:hypothetical protein